MTIGHVGSKCRSLGQILEKKLVNVIEIIGFAQYTPNSMRTFIEMKACRSLKMGHVVQENRYIGQICGVNVNNIETYSHALSSANLVRMWTQL